MKNRVKGAALAAMVVLAALLGSGASKGKTPGAGDGERSIAVFVPGFTAGSPIYAMLAEGTSRAVEDYRAKNPGAAVKVTVIEAGVNQAEWESRLTTLAAGGTYDLIVSSNPSLPAIAAEVSAKFPRQKFLLLDGEMAGNPQVYSLRYNQREQAYMAGHLAALIAGDLAAAAGGNRPRKVGLVAGQEYPVMTGIIRPAYEAGARAVDPAFSVDFRVVGNWFDAGKGAELAADMIRNGAAVILCVAGGANEGVVQAAAEAGARVIWFDINGYNVRPGIVAGSAILRQDRAAYEKTMLYLEGALPFGSAELVGAAEGYVDFVEDDPLYLQYVGEETRRKQAALCTRIRSGDLKLGD